MTKTNCPPFSPEDVGPTHVIPLSEVFGEEFAREIEEGGEYPEGSTYTIVAVIPWNNGKYLFELGKNESLATVYNQPGKRGGNHKLNELLEPLLKEMGATYAHTHWGDREEGEEEKEEVFLEIFFRPHTPYHAMCRVRIWDGGERSRATLEVILEEPTEDIERLGAAFQVLYNWLKAPVTE